MRHTAFTLAFAVMAGFAVLSPMPACSGGSPVVADGPACAPEVREKMERNRTAKLARAEEEIQKTVKRPDSTLATTCFDQQVGQVAAVPIGVDGSSNGTDSSMGNFSDITTEKAMNQLMDLYEQSGDMDAMINGFLGDFDIGGFLGGLGSSGTDDTAQAMDCPVQDDLAKLDRCEGFSMLSGFDTEPSSFAPTMSECATLSTSGGGGFTMPDISDVTGGDWMGTITDAIPDDLGGVLEDIAGEGFTFTP